MDHATLIKGRASWAWDEYAATGGLLRTMPGAPSLRGMLEDLAERVFHLTIIEDETLSGTNVEGEFNREEGLILLRPDLPPDRIVFVIAHELGHSALDHPLHRITDTADHIDSGITPDDLSVERQQRVNGIDLSDAALTALRGYNQRDLYEMQANAFATELLVPSQALREAIQREPDVDVSVLASRLGVSDSLIRVGLAQALFTPCRAVTNTAPAAAIVLEGKQEDAADCPTPALIIAGPGAGKTRVLVARYARLVNEGIPPRQILALTFANKAAGEMRERLATLVGEENAASVEVATFHAFGLQLLQQYGTRIGLKLPLRLITPMDALLLFRRRAARMALGVFEDLPKALENLGKLLKAVARSKEENAGPERWQELASAWESANPGADSPLWAGDGVAFYLEYQKTLRRHGLLDYGDLQMDVLRLFSIPEVAAEIRDRYQCVLVDEFQDINFVSGQLVRALDGGRGIVWAVGDPRQSIYGFRGASPVNLSRFRSADYYPGARIITLDKNYRSVPDIVLAGASVPVPPPDDPEMLPPPLRARRSAEASDPAVTAVSLPAGEDERLWLAEEIRRRWKEGAALSDFAVLTRRNKHAAQVAAALTNAGVPHRWGGPIQDRPVFCVLTSALLLAADDPAGIVGLTTLAPLESLPLDITLSESDRRALLAEGRGGWKAKRLLAAAYEGQIEGVSAAGKEACRSLHQVASALSSSARPHHNLCVYLFEHAGWLRRLLTDEAQEDAGVRATLATVGQALDIASSFAAQREALARSAHDAEAGADEEPDHLETETGTKAFLSYLKAALQSGGLGVPNELDVEGDAVSLITAHRSKGLEWPVVFIPYCMEGEFPGKEGSDDTPLPPGLIVTDEADPSKTHLREEACLFYVAVTRAQNKLFVSSADSYGPRTRNPLSFLCKTMVQALSEAGRVDQPAVASSSPDRPEAETKAGQDWLPYSVPQRVNERDLRLYEECPRKFQFQHIYGLRDDDSAYLAFYKSVYNAARDAAGNPDLLREHFETRWREAGPPEDHWQAPLLRLTAERLIKRMEVQLASGEPKAYRKERFLELGASEDGVSYGICFKVDEEGIGTDGKKTFRRHKQGSRLPKKAPDEDIVTLYAMLAEQESPDAKVTFYYPHLDEDLPVSIGPRKKANLRAGMLQTIGAIKRGEMLAKPGDNCKRCPYSLICDRK